jgi:hypothetical protein
MGLRNQDAIAHEFSKLMGQAKIQKIAQAQVSHDSVEDSEKEFEADFSISSLSDDELSDLFIKEDETSDSEETALDGAIEEHLSMASFSYDQNAKRIMEGLGKISASLASKGETFAADVVRATASSIESDFRKEAFQKNQIVSSLEKMASDFENSGDFFASDLVKATLNKIT